MAGTKISELPVATTLTGAELVPVVQSGATKQTTLAQMPYVPAGTGAVTTTVQAKLRETVSVLDFGADPTGVADSTAAIQAALDSGAASVFFPKGEYVISATLNVPGNISIAGAGYENVLINGYALIDTDAIFYLTGGDQYSTIDNLTFKGQASGAQSIGIKVVNGYSVSYTNLKFLNLSYGLLFDEAGSCLVKNCTFYDCTVGAQCGGGSAYTFAFNNFNGSTGLGIELVNSASTGYPTGAIISQCIFASSIGIRVPTATGAYGGHNFVADSCYFEGLFVTCQPFNLGSGSDTYLSAVTITNCRMAQSASSSSVFAKCTTLTFTNNICGTAITFPTSILQVTLGNNIFVGALTNGATKSINLDDVSNFRFLTDRLTPLDDGADYLGDSSHRWNAAYIQNGLVLDTAVVWKSGFNSPEGVLTAPVGSLYTVTNGGAGTTLYVKESGTGNTGWVAK